MESVDNSRISGLEVIITFKTHLRNERTTMEQKSNLTKAQKYLFGIGDFCGDMSMSFKTYYWSFFMTSVIMMPLDKIQWMNGIQSVLGMIFMFFYGIILDAFPTLKWGHYRSIYLVITPIYAVLVSLAWWLGATVENYDTLIVLLLVSNQIFTIFFQLVYSGNITMIQVLAKGNETDANTLASHRWACIKAAVIVLGFVVAPSLKALGGADQKRPYAVFATCVAVLSLFGYAVHFIITKGAEEEGTGKKLTAEEKAAKKAKRVTFGQMIKALVTNKYLVILLAANIFTTCTSFWYATYGTYYYNYAVGRSDLYSWYITSTNIFAMVGSLVSDYMAKKMPLKKVSCITIILCIAAFAGCKLCGLHPVGFTGCICAYQFLAAINYPCFIAQYGNCVTYSEWKNGYAARGTIMSVSSWTPTIGGLINGQLGPIMLRRIGFDATLGLDGQPETVAPGLVNALSLIPIAFYICAFCIFTFAYTLTADKLKQYQDEINARNAAKAE